MFTNRSVSRAFSVLFVLIFMLTQVSPAYAAPGDLDPTFGSNGYVTTPLVIQNYNDSGKSISIQASAEQPDSKIVIVGWSYLVGVGNVFTTLRYNRDGGLDTSFDGDGVVTTSVGGSSDQANSVAIQQDGKIILAGTVYGSSTGYNYYFGLVRYNSDGSLDTSFGGDGIVTTNVITGSYQQATSVAIQPDGKIVVVGYSYATSSPIVMVRYNSDGSLDTSFGSGGIVTTSLGGYGQIASSVAIQTDGKIVVVGTVTWNSPSYYYQFLVLRYNGDGSLDTSFDADGFATTSVGTYSNGTAGAIQPDGKIVAAGYGMDNDFAVVRYNNDGSLDTSFSGDGMMAANVSGRDFARSVAIQSDGQIVIAGVTDSSYTGKYKFGVIRLNGSDGSLDISFDGDGILATSVAGDNDEANSVMVQSDGKIVVGGLANNLALGETDFALVRYNNDGTLDSAFDGDGKVITNVSRIQYSTEGYDVAVQSDGKIVMVGGLQQSSSWQFMVTRFNADGSFDTSFDTDGIVTTLTIPNAGYSHARAVEIQGDGKIVVAGFAGSQMVVARYNSDGSLDTSFSTDGIVATTAGGNYAQAYALAIQGDGQIVVGGIIYGPPSYLYQFGIVRLNGSDGSLDTSFDTDGIVTTSVGGSSDTIYSVAIQTDSKIVAAGSAYGPATSNKTHFGVARYNSDGSLDTSFDTDGVVTTSPIEYINAVTSLAIQDDGQILVAGSGYGSPTYNTRFIIARYNGSDGSLDTSFDTDGIATPSVGGSSDQANAMTIQDDGQIVVAGYAYGSATNNQNRVGVVRLNKSNGSLDTTFNDDGVAFSTVSGYSDTARALAIQSDGKIVVAGQSYFSGTYAAVFMVLRLEGGGSAPPLLDQTITVTTNAPASAVYGSSFTVAATTSSSLPVSYSASGACTNIDADFTMISATGDCTVMYDQAGDSNYNPAPQMIEVVAAAPAPSIRYVATTGVDTSDCGNYASPCASITYAISQAVAGNTVEIAAGTYTEAGITVDKDLILTGAGASSTVVQAATSPGIATDRVFFIQSSGKDGVVIEDMTIQNGNISGAAGGGIYNAGTLTLNNSTVSDNSSGQNGGGIFNTEARLTLNNSTVTNNSSTDGGGIYNNRPKSRLTLNNSTVSGNLASENGGGIYNNGTMTLNYSTVASNTSDSDTNSAGGGGGIFLSSGMVNLKNSIVAGNRKGTIGWIDATTDCAGSGTMISQGYNLTSTGTGCNVSGTGDITVPPANVFTDVLDFSLADNGGATQTHALLVSASNPVLDIIPNGTNDCGGTAPFDFDQRGEPRPFNGNCDIGAYEAQSVPPAPANLVVTKTADTDDGTCDSDCSLREAIDDALDGDTIVFDAGLAGQTIHFSNYIFIGKDISIDGSALSTQIILSGDSDNNGTGDVRLFSMSAGANVNFNSLTLTKGYVNGTNAGGAIHNGGILTITNSFFIDNSEKYGGAIYSSGSLTVTNSLFTGNSATTGGGAIFASGMLTNTVTDSTFINNSATDGGAIYDSGTLGLLIVTNSTFSSNSATNGGALYNHFGNLVVANSTLSGNSANRGGGIANSGILTVTNSTLSGNIASVQGGGIYNIAGTSGTLNYVNTIIANSASGGNCSNSGGSIGVNINNLVEDGSCSAALSGDPNLAALADNGGPTQTMALLFPSPVLDSGDNATCAASPVNNLDQRGVARPYGTNCDIGAYESDVIFTDPVITESDPQSVILSLGSSPIPFALTLNATDPQNDSLTWSILTPASRGTATVTAGTGNSNVIGYTPSEDYAGSDSFVVHVEDTGAHTDTILVNVTIRGVRFVKWDAAGTEDGTSWADAFTDLQSALSAASSGDDIWVAAGTYKPGTLRTDTFTLKNGVAIYGGFTGTETLLSQRDPTTNLSTLSGDLNGDDGANFANNVDNSYHVVTTSGTNSTASLDGFSIVAGNANGSFPHSHGGGVYNGGSSTLHNLSLGGNSAQYGGGMYNTGSSILTNIIFTANKANADGGGMLNAGGSLQLSDVTFSDNAAGIHGGGLHNAGSAPSLNNVTFRSNTALYGGGMYVLSGSTLTNVTFYDNSAEEGGAMFNDGANPSLTNVTFSGNTATGGAGGAILNYDDSNPTIKNSIFWGNSTEFGMEGTPSISDSIVAGGCPAGGVCTNVIDADPLLGTLANNGGFTQTMALGAASPAINAGNNATCATTDQRGVVRPFGINCDMGAYEYDIVNTAPIITEDTSVNVIMSEDGSPTAFDLTLHATDNDGDTLTWSIGNPAGHGTATASGTGLSKIIGYTPQTNYNGTDSFNVQVSDGNGGTDTITVNVTITPVNAVPSLDAIDPASARVDDPDLDLDINGTNFASNAVIKWRNITTNTTTNLVTTYVSSTELSTVVPSALLVNTGTFEISVFNPAPGGGTSISLPFFVTQTAASIISSDTATSTNPTGTAVATTGGSGAGTPGSITATGTGSGTVTVTIYDSNPRSTSPFRVSGKYFDVYVAQGSNFSSVKIVACNMTAFSSVRWLDSNNKWKVVNPQSYSNGCITMNLSNTSLPKISQLTGTIFGVEESPVKNIVLIDSQGGGLAGATAQYYVNGWRNIPGSTDADGILSYDGLGLSGNITFRITYANASVQKQQNVTNNPEVTFQTQLVSMQLLASDGTTVLNGDAQYYSNGWLTFGNGSTTTSMELLPLNYTFRVSYGGASVQKQQNIGNDPAVVFQTKPVSMQLLASNGSTELNSSAEYYANGWKTFGGGSTSTTMELLPVNYTFRVSYGGASIQKQQDVNTNAVVVFQTKLASMQLLASNGTTELTGTGEYYANGWKTFGSGSTSATMELLPVNYTFRVSYGGASVQKQQDVNANPLVVFQTKLVTMKLLASNGITVLTGGAEYYANGWKTFGNGSTTTTMELLPVNYTFRISYGGASVQKQQDANANQLVVFQTGQVHSNSASATQYYANGWKAFVQDMELLPGSYPFKFNDGTPQTTYSLIAGTINNIH